MILLSSYLFLQAENSTSGKPERNVIILQRDGKSNHKNRPRCPDRQVVYCSYDGEFIRLNFVFSEGSIDIHLENNGDMIHIPAFDSEGMEYESYVGFMSGSININVETEYGNCYTGTLGND